MKYVDWLPLIDGMLEAVWVVDAGTLQVLCANQAAAHLQGLSKEELVGTPVFELNANLEDQFFWQAVQQDTQPGIHSDTTLRYADGHTVQVERRVSTVIQEDHKVFLVAMQDKSQQHRIQEQLEHLLAELRATLESTADGILVCDLDGKINAFNRLFATLWELPEELLSQHDDAAVHAWMTNAVPDPEQYRQKQAHIQRSPLLESTDVLVLRCGRVLERITRPQLARGRPIGRVYAFRDVTERTATEAQLQLAAKVFDNSPDAIFVTDPQHRILVCNPAALKVMEGVQEQLAGLHSTSLFYSPKHPGWQRDMVEKLAEQGHWDGELWFKQQDGSAVALQASWVLLRNAQGEPLNTVLFARDLSEKLATQQRIEQLAYTDALTGLPNRMMLTERVTFALRMSERSGKGFAMLFLDLDRFKQINDSLGHLFGDMVLIEVANRLKSCLRQTDTLSRLGGDEFVIHLHEADTTAAERTAERIIASLSQPVTIDEMSFSLSCSVGIAMYPNDGKTLDELVQNADTAMYRVKERGKGHYRFYQPKMNADLLSRIQLDHAMREGLQRQEFVLHYQPRVSLSTGQSVACEALVRWQNPEKGLVPPGTFISVAEETGFIVPLGTWILDEAVRQAATWTKLGHPYKVAVNVSALQFQQTHFVTQVAECLQRHGLPASLLELELTESILIHDAEEALERLQALAALGVALSLDDFGTGYSSLAYLKRFPLHQLKIDRSFIISAHEQPSDATIVAAIVQMGHALGLEVVAEGVELPEQRDLLQKLRCDQYQGYLYAQPLPAAAFEERFLRV
jgi:diguanylate cyclase (GGDEF)-like protein/PAS domain S-box-containing protein